MHIAVNDREIHYDTFGDGPPVLFVHGFPLSGSMWSETARGLSDRWRCIVPDLRGHGCSAATATVSIADFADDLAGLLDALGEGRPAVLAGLSMGGIIAFEFFRRHRTRLRALVLSNTRANPETPEGAARREAIAQAVLRDGSRAGVDAMIGQVFGPGFPSARREEWARRMAENPPIGVAAAARALAGRADSFPTLPRIDCPTLVVAGDQDAITPPDLMRDMHQRIRGSEFAVVPDSGHVPPVEQPERFAAAIRRFLERLESGARATGQTEKSS